jgi:hypothetical protein
MWSLTRSTNRGTCGATGPPQGWRFVTVIATIGALGFAAVAQAQTVPGGFCPVAEVRVNGVPGSMLREKLWEYRQDKPPAHPVFGSVDMACWFVADAIPIDIAKRAWFAVGSRGSPAVATQSVLEFADAQTVSSTSGVGVTHEGLAIFGNVSPNHDCVFAVYVWSETCPHR